MAASTYEISAAALHAARTLLRNFHLVEKSTILPTERNVAILIDVCTQVFRIESAVEDLVKHTAWQNKDALKHNLERLREAIYAVDIAHNQMPHFDQHMAVPAAAVTAIKEHMNRPEVRNHAARAQEKRNDPKFIAKRQQMARRLTQARTAQEQQQILKGV